MIEVPLTRGHVAIVDDEDAWVAAWKWQTLRIKHLRYAVRTTQRTGQQRTMYLHRVILNAPQGREVDHRDGDGLNNRRSNLRLATQTEQRRNARRIQAGYSALKGVSFDRRVQPLRKRWRAQISCEGTRYNKRFETEQQAAAQYAEWATELFGDFAVKPAG